MNLAFLYVALVYGLAVALLRRYDDRLRPWAAAFFYLLVLGFFFGPLTTNVVDVPANFLRLLFPWVGVMPATAVPNSATNDVILQFVPWAHQVREAWSSLEVPLWNSASGGGYPLLANAQSGALSPFRILALPMDLGTSFAVEGAFKLLLALTFAYLWARRRDFSEAASVVVAVAFTFSTGIVTWLHFPHTSVTAFLPLTFYSIDRVIDRGARKDVILVAVSFAAALVSGHPESAAHVLSTGGAWFAFAAWIERRGDWRKALGQLAAASLIALLLASPFLLPFLEALPHSQRVDALRNGMDSTPVHRSLDLLVLMMHPRFFGDVDGQPWGPVHPEFLNGSAGMLAVAGWLAVLFWVVVERKWRDRLAFFVYMVPLALGAVFSIPPVSLFFESVPPFSLAANSRLRIVICWLVAVCAGAMIDLVRKGKIRLSAAAGSVTLVLLVASFHAFDVTAYDFRLGAITTTVPGLLSIAAVFLFAFSGRWQTVGGVLVVAFIVLELWPVGLPWNEDVPASDVYPRIGLTDRLERLIGEDPITPVRIAGLGPVFVPNASVMYGFEDIRAHDPMANAKTLGMLRVFAGYSTDEYIPKLKRVGHPFIDFMNVRYVVTAEHEWISDPGFVEVYRENDGRIYRNDEAMERFMISSDVFVEPDRRTRVRRVVELQDWANEAIVESLPRPVEKREDEDRIEIIESHGDSYGLLIEASGPRLIVTSIPWFPGWSVTVDGADDEPVRVDEGFLGFVVPGGSSNVRVAYRPASFSFGVALFFVGLTSLVVIQAWPAIRRSSLGSARAGIVVLLAAMISLGTAACSGRIEQDDSSLAYPGAHRLEEQELVLKRSHRLTNPGATEDPSITVLESEDPIESVAMHYAKEYGIARIAEDNVNDFSASLPPAYYREGDLGSDLKRFKAIVHALELPFEPDEIRGSYRATMIKGLENRPTITIQRPYVELTTGRVIDRTVILISR